ncbi:MAG: glycosyltransferase [Candidatus Latescibacteria bacterium]|nr:glycosyltransferase [Candidatus Latescibacterota bacterium]NIO56740.1 glycosyltransferase [Candidatus Latescibacterota bacterium]NIT02325.1 glycosyltransferase [Candidatus Latescibacterota bacterium]NIT39208.1 glycosyltransferase [Candidatus Latescibacterota bacterium]
MTSDTLAKTEHEVDISVVLPAYNEAEAILGTIKEVEAAIESSHRRYELIVVDDGSTDDTSAEARKSSARVIRHSRNKGYGAALKTGTLSSRGDIIVFFDADNQFEAQDIERMVDELEDAEATLGNRTSGSYAPFSRKGGKKLLSWFANYLAKQKIPDLNCGLRAIRRDVLMRYLHLLPNGFSASTTTTLVLLKEGHEVKFVPIIVKKRIGKSTVRPLRDGMDTALLVLRLTTLLDPFRVFGPMSIFLFVSGVGWGLRYIIMRRGLSVLALFLLVSAVMIFFFGLLADQVASLRRERRYSDKR